MRKGLTPDLVKANFRLEKAKEGERLKGGKADGKKLKDIAAKHGVSVAELKAQFKMGVSHELEHTNDKKVATEIAKDHLMESPKYYHELAEMEDELKKE